MKRLEHIVRSATPDKGVHFREMPYGSKGIASFLRDTLAMANASVDGSRFIIVGAVVDGQGFRRLRAVSEKDFNGKPDYTALAKDFVEPALEIRYEQVLVDGKRVGVFEIGNCHDRPYMMRIDYSETLRRGDAYMRTKGATVKMGRRQLQSLFEKRFRDTQSETNIDVGFPGEIIHKKLTMPSCDMSQLPSAVAASKLEQLLKVHMKSSNSGSTTVMARLVHARLFGSDDPYISRTPAELIAEIEEIGDKYRDDDLHYLFETQAQKLQLVVCNQGNEPIVDASIALVLPKDDDLYIADHLPKVRRNGRFIGRAGADVDAYPTVSLHKKAIHITKEIGDLPVEEPVEAFRSPVRLCLGPGLIGRRFGIRYALHGQNLSAPATGMLRLNFRH